MKRLVRVDMAIPLILGGIAGTVVAHTHASTGVVYLIGVVFVIASIGLVLHEERIDIRRTIYNPFRGRRRKT